MKTVSKSVLIWYSPEEMFNLVTDVASYPKFLPWCDRASVLSQEEGGMTAQVGISFGGIHQSFTTRNTHVPGREVHLQLIDGPFSQLEGRWKFQPVGGEDAKEQRACRIEFELRYGFSNIALATLVGPVFDRIAGSMVDAFVKRADVVYGG
jgi:ribosome-associated toxin RatA of RatAB toxin-antitoxin module